MNPESHVSSTGLSAGSARTMASLFNLGNVLALLPGMLMALVVIFTEPDGIALILMLIVMMVPPIFWFGISIVVYTIARHHPNPRVGYYTQQAAYRFYGMLGIVIPVGTFYGTQWFLWIITGAVVGLVIVPWSIWDLLRIQRETWQDTEIQQETQQ